MITSDELEYLVEETIRFFKEGSEFDKCYYEDVAWDYARGILENTLDDSKKQDLYSRLIKKLNNDYKDYKINFSEEEHKIEFSNNNTVYLSDEKERAILLFLMDYNRIRFIMQKSNKQAGYIIALSQAIGTILSEKKPICGSSSYEDIFEDVKNLIYKVTKTKEYVATAKILMLLDPGKFIAWDDEIAKKFGLDHNKNNKSRSEYKRFNELIDKFIKRNNILVDCMVDYAEQYTKYKNYIRDNNPYEIKKLLDMIFWISYNNKNVSSNRCLTSKFYDLTKEFVKSYILINENE